jgi:hypothetical protein
VTIPMGVGIPYPDFLNTADKVRSAIPTTARREAIPFQKK